MKKVVITGSKGGTGPSIMRVFRDAGYEVLGVDLKPCGIEETDYRQVDLEDGAQVHDVFAGAHAVVHFGSLPIDVWTSWETAFRNIMLGGYHVLQAAANLRIPRLVLASSPMIYGEYDRTAYFPIDEESPAAPIGIYGAAKQSLEMLAQNYSRWHGLAIAALRPQSIVYEGAYEWRLREYTDVDAVGVKKLWSFVDARDVATACLAWIQSEQGGFQAFNVASDNVCVRTPTRELIRQFYPQITDLRHELAGRTGLVSCAKIKRLLGWQPRHDWPAMEAESDAGRYGRQPPPR